MLSHGALLIYCMPLERASPQSGDGACEPSPRNDSVVVDIIVPGRFIDTITIRDGTTLGSMYLNISEAELSPNALPVSTNAMDLRDKVFARTGLA